LFKIIHTQADEISIIYGTMTMTKVVEFLGRIDILVSMKRIMPLLIAVTIGAPAFGAKYSGEFLYLGVGGRPLSMGGAYTAESGDVLAGYYNPAGLSRLNRPEAIFMHSETFGSLLNHDFLAYARPSGSGSTQAAFGISLYRLGGGGIIVTDSAETGRFFMVSEESHADYVGYFSYGRMFGKRLSAGISTKLIYRDIVDESAAGIGLDFGAIYAITDWADLGVNVQDAPSTLISYSTGMKERVNPTAKTGAKLHGKRGRFETSLLADTDIRFEGRDFSAQASAGPVSFDFHFGLEVRYMKKLSARIGSDIGNLSLGAGMRFNRFTIDIAMRDHSDLDHTYLVSLILLM
jgi:hypothetical protein